MHIQSHTLIHQRTITLQRYFNYYCREEMQYFLLTWCLLDLPNNAFVNHLMNQNPDMELIFSKIALLLSSQIQRNHLLL